METLEYLKIVLKYSTYVILVTRHHCLSPKQTVKGRALSDNRQYSSLKIFVTVEMSQSDRKIPLSCV